MRCGYLTFQPAQNDENTWSGLNFHIRRALCRAGFDLVHVGGLARPASFGDRLKSAFFTHIVRKGFDLHRDTSFLRRCASNTERKVKEAGPFDLLFAPSSYPLTFLRNQIPKVVWLDSTFAGLVGYYPDFQNISRKTLRDGVRVEAEALRNCSAVIFSSEWAAQTAVSRYGLNERRVHVIPFGANLESPYHYSAEALSAIRSRGGPPYQFLFLGVDWNRKGGPLAVEVVRRLNALGLPCHLKIIGCRPAPAQVQAPNVTVVGYLDKTKPADSAHLLDLLAAAHFLILPTRAEAYGLVFAEAAAFGVPSLAIRTGGVPMLVRDSQTGLLFDPDNDSHAWTQRIAPLLRDHQRYAIMATAAFERYLTVLNWRVAADALRKVMSACVTVRPGTKQIGAA